MGIYRIEGAQNFRITADDPETAFGMAAPAAVQFPPLKITGPSGEMSLADLRREAEQAKQRKRDNA